jgi:segregation and condensation protein B
VSEPYSERQLTTAVEAMLFLGGKPVTATLFAARAPDVDESKLAAVVGALNARYRRQRRPYTVEWQDGGWRLRLDPATRDWLRDRLRPDRGVKLGRQQLEVLAVVAYKQPIARPAVEALTHADASAALRRLLRLRLIEQSENPGDGQTTFVTTPRFLEAFRVASLAELPALEDWM